MSKFKQVYQFKITLLDTKPPIWRRIQVPENYRFWDLHVAIQDAMGWKDCHLHEFSIFSPSELDIVDIGLAEEDYSKAKIFQRISKFFSRENSIARYWYDFGDDWYHQVNLEKILPADPNQTYPCCLAGKRACPPEDSGGVWGFYEKLKILQDPKNECYEDILEWMGRDYDPEYFDPKKVIFDDPKEREISLTSLY
ncbi:MAG: plasmid pRiA4b ORF-3 family protein [Candidatus Cloacimonetes bacterium]|jgi:hypothetical protein|nr:plasmid pRiA4b ORF-3 family protein [Candidatus Cloacimonadota bacterium]MDY0366818.1 plasmid pRiA4b ORF-3 family protein [Candidatus Syntrophosphaera sp.]